MPHRRRFTACCYLGLVCALATPQLSGAQSIEPERWFPADVPPAEAIREDDFVGHDPRYLHMVRTLAEAIVYLSESSTEIETGYRASHLMDAAAYQAHLEQVRELEAEYAAQGRDASEIDMGRIEPSGDPDLPYRQVYENTSTLARVFASPQELRVQETSDWSISVHQRAWGGRQTWWRDPDDDGDPHAAQLNPASSPGPDDNSSSQSDWFDVRLLSQMLASLLAAGPPNALLEAGTSDGLVFHMVWRKADGRSSRLVTNPKRGYAPIEWSRQYVFNRYAAERTESEERIAQYREYLAKAEPEERADLEESLQYWERDLEELRAAPLENVSQRFLFTAARESSAYEWAPARIELVSEDRTPIETSGAQVTLGNKELEEAKRRAAAMPEYVRWIAWTDIRGRATPRAAFTPPTDYEAYQGQQWVDMTAPADVDARRELADRLREGIALMPGQDPYGKGRWLVADADDAQLGQWPIQPGDVFLLAGCTCLEPLEIEPDEEGRGPIEKIAQAIADAEPDNPATLRVARDDQLIDIVCWVPKSESLEDRLAMQQAMLKSHEYDPLPSDTARVFAQAVLNATDKLVRGK